MRNNFLRSTLAKESRAYGFTIAFWGSGAALIQYHGLPSMVEALSYGFGAVLGFGLLSVLAYRKAFETAQYEENELMVLSTVHYIASLVPIAIAFLLGRLEPGTAHLIVGGLVSVSYNLGMLVEELLSEKALKLEKKLVELF